MNFIENIRLAFGAIRSNLLRTILTLAIIAVGIAALVGILTAVDAIKASLSSSFQRMGSNTVDLRKWNMRSDDNKEKVVKNISWEDAQQFTKRFNYPSTTSISTFGNFMGTIKFSNKKTNPNIRIMGGDENYINVAGYEIKIGRDFSIAEIEDSRHVALVGSGIVSQLFESDSKAIGKSITVDNIKCRIIGILKSKGSGSAFNPDNVVVLPVSLVREKYQSNNRTFVISVMVDDVENLAIAEDEAIGTFRAIRKVPFGNENDFEVVKSDAVASNLLDNLQYFTYAAQIIGLITLLGAGIGLMNIMLVSVAERTREIGVSKAIGASANTILKQYLIESLVICQLGGLLGIFLGIAIGNVVSLVMKGPFIIPWNWIGMGIFFCFIVGLGAGIYPAIKASRLEPIESLRYE